MTSDTKEKIRERQAKYLSNPENRARVRQQNKDRRKRLVDADICANCGKVPAEEDRVFCANCLRRGIENGKERTKRKIDSGCCVRCGSQDVLPSLAKKMNQQQLCEVCYLKKRSRNMFKVEKHWSALKNKFDAQGGMCAYTGEILELGVNDSVDHILPIYHYPDLACDVTNVEWVTRKVNEMKRDRTPDEFLALIEKILLYRSETWPDVGACVLREAVCFS